MIKLTEKPGNSGFEARLGSVNSLVTLGGYQSDKRYYRADTHCLAHGGEVFINVRKPISALVDKPLLINGRVEALCDGEKHRMYIVNGETEHEIEFASQPASNVIQYEITDSGNVDYIKQELTVEDIAAGAVYSRPMNEGCIVGYIQGKRDNKYQTGKVWQLSRPWLTDSKGNTVWCEINIYPDGRGKQILIVTMPQDYLKGAIYPVSFLPILGYDTKGASIFNTSQDTYYNKRTIASEAGIVTRLAGYWATAGLTLKMGICRTQGNTIRSQPVYAQGAETVTGADGTITDFPVTPLLDIVIGESYICGYAPSGLTAPVYYDNVSSTSGEDYIKDYPNEMQNPAPAITGFVVTNRWHSVWAEYGGVAIGRTRSKQAQPLGIKEAFRAQGSGQARNISAKGGFK